MPFYNIICPPGKPNANEMRAIAADITEAHCSITGAPKQFVHVIFTPYEPQAAFSGGRASNAILVRANIRAGRTQEVKEILLNRLTDIVRSNVTIEPKDVLVSLIEIPGTNVMEGGVLLSHPDYDAQWFALHGRQE